MHSTDEILKMIENRLAPAERARVEAHLRLCAACSAEFVEQRDLADALRRMSPALDALAASPSRTWPEVWERLRGRAAPRRASWQFAMGMTMVIALLAFTSLRVGAMTPAPAAATMGAARPPSAWVQTPPAPWPSLTTDPRVQARSTTTGDLAGLAVNTLLPPPVPIPIPIPSG